LEKPRDNIKMEPKEIGYEMEDWMHLDKDRFHRSKETFRNKGEK
jgi:hypothetical protein